MKKLSIKARITLWYTLIMVIITVLTLGTVMAVSRNVAANAQKNELKNTVSYIIEDVSLVDGEIVFDDDFKSFINSTHISIYNDNGQMLLGRLPAGFDSSTDFLSEAVQTQNDWYIYDIRYELSKDAAVWLRGITPHTETDNLLTTFARICTIILPLLIAVAAVGGWLLTKKAFKPIVQINNTAEQINSGKDLTKRIELDSGKDEIHDIAHTFNGMFDRLEQAFETEKRFTSEASHELRTPVAVIMAQCEYVMQNDVAEKEKNEAIATIFGQAKKMSTLISQLLMLARADNSSKALELDTVNISELAQIVAEQQEFAAEEKNISIVTDIQPDILMKADETMMMRLFINLIENSIKYGRNGGVTKISLNRDGDKTVIRIEDNGIGIAPEHLPKIWERFYRVDKSRSKSDSDSTGLGLPMVKWIVEAHGGTVDATSETEKGTVFTVTF